MSRWKIKWLPEAVKDLEEMDGGTRKRVLKALQKLEADPLGYGKPLGEKIGIDLAGLRKIGVQGYRIVYLPREKEVLVVIVAVGKRERFKVYKTAAKRIAEYSDLARRELEKLSDLLK